MEASGSPARDTVYVGDHPANDTFPAARTGLRTVHIRRGAWAPGAALGRRRPRLRDCRLGGQVAHGTHRYSREAETVRDRRAARRYEESLSTRSRPPPTIAT
ncbi:hypothetical protein AB0H24_04395 [Streptomyces globisporus]|uniref:hypothetical protein n=1 Tax=Streptomyces globisporus TaxID=1908 RepID=UPI00345F1992